MLDAETTSRLTELTNNTNMCALSGTIKMANARGSYKFRTLYMVDLSERISRAVDEVKKIIDCLQGGMK